MTEAPVDLHDPFRPCTIAGEVRATAVFATFLGARFPHHQGGMAIDPDPRLLARYPHLRPLKVYDVGRFARSCPTWISLGFSHYPWARGDGKSIHYEAMLASARAMDFIPELFMLALQQVAAMATQCGPGFFIDGFESDYPDLRALKKTGLLFAPPMFVPEGFGSVETPDLSLGILMTVFVSREEIAFLKTHGGRELLSRLQASGLDLLDPARPSLF
jgi:hypothetical protein